MRVRLRTIWCAIWFGVLPWWVYEERPHYSCTWWEHLCLNLRYAWRWVLREESEEDREFEREVNARPNWIRGIGRRPRLEAEQILGPEGSEYTIAPEE